MNRARSASWNLVSRCGLGDDDIVEIPPREAVADAGKAPFEINLFAESCGGQLDLDSARLAPMLLAEMERHGIPTGSYNVPKWEDSPEGFRCLLDSLFKHSPPTALIVDEVPHLVATLQFCGLRGIRVPQDLSLACLEHRFDLDYCVPAVTHIRWDEAPIVRRIAHWANAVARGKTDHRQGFAKLKLVEGGTIGPAAARK